MSKKQTKNVKNKGSLSPLYIVLAVAVICLIGLIVFAAVQNRGKDSDNVSQTGIAEEIAKLDIKQNPVVTIEMENGGIIKAELYPEIAPNTVCNFISLANSGFYDGLIFHRCIKDFMIQGGDPLGTGTGDPGYRIKGEFTNNGFENNLKHERGVLSMARQMQPMDSAGSQFFIMVADSTYLDGDYAAFGKVTEGMETVDEIVAQETDQNDKPLQKQVMKKVTVETFGIEYPEPEKIDQ